MAARSTPQQSPPPLRPLAPHLASLTRSCIAEPDTALAPQAAAKAWSHVDDLARRMEGETDVQGDRATTSRRRVARFPVMKPLEQCRWDWPTRRNRLPGHNHGRVALLQATSTRIFLGGGGLGTPHLATARGSPACLQGSAVLLARAIDGINTLAAAKNAGRRKAELKQYTQPARRILDECGSLPMDQTGAERLCHVISLRDAQGAIILTSTRVFKEWPTIFNPDSPRTSAVLDRLLPHADTILIAGKRCRMKAPIER